VEKSIREKFSERKKNKEPLYAPLKGKTVNIASNNYVSAVIGGVDVLSIVGIGAGKVTKIFSITFVIEEDTEDTYGKDHWKLYGLNFKKSVLGFCLDGINDCFVFDGMVNSLKHKDGMIMFTFKGKQELGENLLTAIKKLKKIQEIGDLLFD
jgi:hypothetical protein